jgi:large subunit ribosomal protein L18
MNNTSKSQKRTRRHARVRARVSGSAERPRLSVFKSNRSISVQIIDDVNGKTLASAHSRDSKGKTFSDKVGDVGSMIAEKAKDKKITEVVFDRGGFLYTGHIKSLADKAREGGLKF